MWRYFGTSTIVVFALLAILYVGCNSEESGGECSTDADCPTKFGEVWVCDDGVCVEDSGSTDGDTMDDDDDTATPDDDDDDDNDDVVSCNHGEQWCDGKVRYVCIQGVAQKETCVDQCIETGYQETECVGGVIPDDDDDDNDDSVDDDDDDNDDSSDACNPNPCVSPHRTKCEPNGDSVICSCDDGYVMSGNDCVPDSGGNGFCENGPFTIADATLMSDGAEVPISIQVTENDTFLFVDVSFALNGSNSDDYADKKIKVKTPGGDTLQLWNENPRSNLPALFRLSRFAGQQSGGTWQVIFQDTEPMSESLATSVCVAFHKEDEYDSADFDNGASAYATGTIIDQGSHDLFFFISEPRKVVTNADFKSGWPVSSSERSQFSFSLTTPDGTVINIDSSGVNLNTDIFSQTQNKWATGMWKLHATNNSAQMISLENPRIEINQ